MVLTQERANPMLDQMMERAQLLIERGLYPRAYSIILFLEDALGEEDARVKALREKAKPPSRKRG